MSRDNMFYWQSDRPYTAEQINAIFLQRKTNYRQDEVKAAASYAVKEEVVRLQEAINQGSVNIVCPFTTKSGKHGVIRVHPPQVKNGYFFVEREAMNLASGVGVPTPKTILVEDSRTVAPFDYMVMEKVEGDVMRPVVEQNPSLHPKLLKEIGSYLGKLHQIRPEGYGFFDNKKARNGVLSGIHQTNEEHFLSALDLDEAFHQSNQGSVKTDLFHRAIQILRANSKVSHCANPTLVHNDIADWNTVVNGDTVTGILDWDECFSGDPVFEFATLSLFYTDDQMEMIKQGYVETGKLPNDYDSKFPLYVMRYIVNKSKIAITKIKYTEKTSMHHWLENALKKLDTIIKSY